MLIDELLTALFDGKPHTLAEPMGLWLKSSRRFATFVNDHHTKIRKKLRTVHEPESLRDLQLELETAYLLLREKTLSVAYEPQHPNLGRSPDFEVSFTTSLTFMVEVTRMRTGQPKALPDPLHEPPLPGERFSDMLCSKLGQMLSMRCNLLLVGVEGLLLIPDELDALMMRLRKRAESNDPGLLQRYGFRDRADFFRYHRRLSAILVRNIPLKVDSPIVLWENPQARFPLPARVRTALSRSHTL
jgi:hypothetical protein